MSFYKMNRGWHDSEFFKNSVYSDRDAWSWFVGAAVWNVDGHTININGRPVKINRGQCSNSLRFLAKKFGWTVSKVNRFLAKLEVWNMVKIDKANGTGQNIVTICNYELYQGSKTPTETPTETRPKQDRNKEEEGKEGKEVKKEDIYPQEFLDVWAVYPAFRKGNKQKSFTAFKNALKRDSIENINQGVQRYIDSDESKNYPKGFAPWFNDDRWKNNYTTQTRGNNDGNLQNKRLGESRSLLEQVRNGAFD